MQMLSVTIIYALELLGLAVRLDNALGLEVFALGALELAGVDGGALRLRNGDTAKKIGTYQAGVLAQRQGVPFIVAAPVTSALRPAPRSTSSGAPPSRPPSSVAAT